MTARRVLEQPAAAPEIAQRGILVYARHRGEYRIEVLPEADAVIQLVAELAHDPRAQ